MDLKKALSSVVPIIERQFNEYYEGNGILRHREPSCVWDSVARTEQPGSQDLQLEKNVNEAPKCPQRSQSQESITQSGISIESRPQGRSSGQAVAQDEEVEDELPDLVSLVVCLNRLPYKAES